MTIEACRVATAERERVVEWAKRSLRRLRPASFPPWRTPTISTLADETWVAINTVIEERIVKELFPRLAEVGARGIVEYPLNKIIE